MWLDTPAATSKQDLVLGAPLVNVSGSLGFTSDRRAVPAVEHLGAFITNPISLRPRVPATNRACIPFPGGFLLHTGHANPGISHAIRRYRRRWAAAEIPVIVHLLVDSPGTLAEMVSRLEGLENILAIEVGLPPDMDSALLKEALAAGVGELPLIPCVSPEQVPLLLESLKDTQPAAVHLVEPRGALPDLQGGVVSGRLYGPAIFPVMLAAARVLTQAGLRVIANGGIRARWQVDALLDAGVMAVGLGSALWGVEGGFSLVNLKPEP
ncbi:MAG: hypothetical protein ACNA70_07590 [Brevefilum sp.]